MIKKIDLGAAMGDFAQATDAAYVYGEDANGNQVKIRKQDFKTAIGVYSISIRLLAGGSFEIPFIGGLLMIQNSSVVHQRAFAILYSNGNGNVIVPESNINFFSEVDNKICVFNTGENKKYIIKNTFAHDRTIDVSFLS